MVVVAAAVAALVAFNVLLWPRVRPAAAVEMEPVSVLIPARNEEKNLPACLEAALAQPGVAEVLVYDDHSIDGTAAAVARYARRDPRVRYRPGAASLRLARQDLRLPKACAAGFLALAAVSRCRRAACPASPRGRPR